ncbi:HAMP domain-containing histidine kinase [Corallococcus macrosporus]|uniref:histidine kinase n=1 Tax=Corallococcus macrosporus TaxID=35 RepID=A0ABS3D3U5_9BACT|nr:HAMP domain-containing sensor histidine kinase [Corallococcus macrosporus]MBN8226311.1 HAMP domain-containing histidine kinase [Corallococcus macrosporus]
MDPTPPVAFENELARVVAAQRRRVLGAGAAVRLVGTAVFFAVSLGLWLTGARDWAHYPPLLLCYGGVVALLFALRFKPLTKQLGVVQSLVDVGLVFGLQQLALPVSPFPAGVAGFSLGLFALVVALSGLELMPWLVYGTAGLASLTQAVLMHQAGVGPGAMVVAAVTLVLVAAVSHYGTGRLRQLAMDLSHAEVARQLEARRTHDVEDAHRTIERMLSEAHARNAQLEALQAHQEQLMQFLVHDLRSPLSAVTLSLSWMEQELPIGTPMVESVRTGLAVTARLDRMISDLLDVPRLEQGRLSPRRQPFPVAPLFDEVRRSLDGAARLRKIRLELSCPPGFQLVGDAGLLIRVVENLATNALRYAPSGGRVRLEAGETEGQQWLAVRNDGIAIPPEARESLFDKYVQGSREKEGRRGYGLGLYFSRLAAEAHGGRLAVEDAEGWATSFVLRLPRAQGASQPAPDATPARQRR